MERGGDDVAPGTGKLEAIFDTCDSGGVRGLGTSCLASFIGGGGGASSLLGPILRPLSPYSCVGAVSYRSYKSSRGGEVTSVLALLSPDCFAGKASRYEPLVLVLSLVWANDFCVESDWFV